MSETESDYLLLKWGGVKAWRLNNPQSQVLMQKYIDLGMSMSAIMQENTPEHKATLCELIRNHTGTIMNDWDGEDYTKERAIEYVTTYGLKKSAA